MNQHIDARPQLLRALVEFARVAPPSIRHALIQGLQSDELRGTLDRFATTQPLKERLRNLEALIDRCPEIDGAALSLALSAASEAAELVESEFRPEIVWTGPGTSSVPMRRVDQAIYEMIHSAESELVLVTYAAYKAEKALDSLRSAVGRGVRLKLILEAAKESGGKISFDGVNSLRVALPSAHFYYWSVESRKKVADSESYGSMHAKCIISDRTRAMISSANLTDYALEVNMELGVIAGCGVASALAEHFDKLIARQDLLPIP